MADHKVGAPRILVTVEQTIDGQKISSTTELDYYLWQEGKLHAVASQAITNLLTEFGQRVNYYLRAKPASGIK